MQANDNVYPIGLQKYAAKVTECTVCHRRYRAAKAAGLTEVEVLIRDPEDERTRRQKSVISNVQREDVGPVEMAEALQAMLDEDDRVQTQDGLAKVIGKDKAWVSGMLRVLSLPEPLRHKVGFTQQSVSYDSMKPTS